MAVHLYPGLTHPTAGGNAMSVGELLGPLPISTCSRQIVATLKFVTHDDETRILKLVSGPPKLDWSMYLTRKIGRCISLTRKTYGKT